MTQTLSLLNNLEVALLPALDGGDVLDPAYQAVLAAFYRDAKPNGQHVFAVDDVDGAGGALGEYIFKVARLSIPHITVAIGAYHFGPCRTESQNPGSVMQRSRPALWRKVAQALRLVEESRAGTTSMPPTT